MYGKSCLGFFFFIFNPTPSRLKLLMGTPFKVREMLHDIEEGIGVGKGEWGRGRSGYNKHSPRLFPKEGK